MNKEKKDIIKKLYLLWEKDRLHIINECHSMTDSIEQEEELTEIKKELEVEFNINV